MEFYEIFNEDGLVYFNLKHTHTHTHTPTLDGWAGLLQEMLLNLWVAGNEQQASSRDSEHWVASFQQGARLREQRTNRGNGGKGGKRERKILDGETGNWEVKIHNLDSISFFTFSLHTYVSLWNSYTPNATWTICSYYLGLYYYCIGLSKIWRY